ncbi:MAG TPA: VOC family protein [Anaerolineales bacterium]
MKIDHVTIAGSRLGQLRAALAANGLQTEYGGPHSNRMTHMALLGFDDGAYLELISTLEPGLASPWWHQHIIQDGGPCAWAVQVDDIAQEAGRISAHGIPVRGPDYYHRERPDGTLVEWDLAFPGDYEPGAKLPFLISDRTLRSLRVQPSPSVTGSELTGIRKVVLGVNDLVAASHLFMQVFDWHAPEIEPHPEFGANLAAFTGQPVILAQPNADNWLQQRLAKFGECPCALLIASRDVATSVQTRNLVSAGSWFQKRVAWFDLPKPPGRRPLPGTRLGVMSI